MNIAIVSPLWRTGTTTVASLLGYLLATTQGKSVCMLETGGMQSRMMTILGMADIEDVTRSISQVIKMLQTGTIQKSELSDYSRKITSNLDLFTIANSKTSGEDSDKLLRFVLDNLEYDITITDVRTPPLGEISTYVLDKADMIINILEPDDHMITEFNKMKKFNKFKEWEDKMIIVVNKYSPYAVSKKDLRRQLKVKQNRLAYLAYNPFIQKVTLKEDFSSILPSIIQADARVIDLHTDLTNILKTVTTNLGIRFYALGVTSTK